MNLHIKQILAAACVAAFITIACSTSSTPRRAPIMPTHTNIPAATSLTSAPLRNRIRVALNAPVPEVWALVGDPSRLPEYSAGLERVETKRGAGGVPEEYACYFKPAEAGGAGAVSRDFIRWYEPARGWASRGEEPNDFGLRNSLHLVTLTPSEQGTLLSWDAYYDAVDLDMNRAGLDDALADIAAQLVARFGGRVVERYVDGSPQRGAAL
jgi:hypothetical protein